MKVNESINTHHTHTTYTHTHTHRPCPPPPTGMAVPGEKENELFMTQAIHMYIAWVFRAASEPNTLCGRRC